LATIILGRHTADSQLNPLGRLGWAVWRTLTSVKFAVLQISVLAVAGVIGAVLRQLPSFALHDPGAYADQMAQIHVAYDPLSVLGVRIGPPMVDLFERLGFFRVFSAPWFVLLLTLLVVSIVVCTLDRTPDLWRKERLVRVAMPPPFFDTRLDERARFDGVPDTAPADVQAILRGHRFRVRHERVAEPAGADIVHVYGDKNQYFKLATLFTHLGLILFLAAAAITTGLGFETVVFLGDGQTAPVQAVGTTDNLLVKNLRFDAPTRPDGSFADFTTDVAVFQNGKEVARKTIRVNDPLEFGGYVFHQNTFGPAETLAIRDPSGALVWDGPVLMTGALAGKPQGFLTIPGSSIGLLLVLDRTDANVPVLAVTGLTADAAGGSTNLVFLDGLGIGQSTDPRSTAGYSVTWSAPGAYTGMVIKRDPGQGLVWLAYLSLMIGLSLSFYFPRRRVWARLEAGKLQLAMLGDRYVDTEREFGKLLDELADRLRNRPERGMQPATDIRAE
jgi:cytochrome c biogenesis protein